MLSDELREIFRDFRQNKPATAEIWTMEIVPEMTEKGEPLVLRADKTSRIPSITGADFVYIMHPSTLEAMQTAKVTATSTLPYFPSIPIFDDDDRRNIWAQRAREILTTQEEVATT